MALDPFIAAALERRAQITALVPEGSRSDSPWGLSDASEIFAWADTIEKGLETQTAATAGAKPSTSDRIDAVLLHPLWGTLIFVAVMWLLFMLAGQWLGPLQDWCASLFTDSTPGAWSLANAISWMLNAAGAGGTWLEAFLIGGICTGLGVVASFLPLLLAIFLFMAVMETSGYLSRVAFLGDRLMRKVGLDGRAILPLIIGFGCNLPSLAAAQTLPNPRHRLVTILIVPYTSCAARLTVYVMIARIFFPANTGTVVLALYALSVLMVILGALILRPFISGRDRSGPLMLVLPTYSLPRLRDIFLTACSRTWSFARGAGKIIVVMTAVVWLLGAIPVIGDRGFADPELPAADSLYGAAAKTLEPVFSPAGFGEWHLTGALITGVVAKETVVSSLAVSYSLHPENTTAIEDGTGATPALNTAVRASFTAAAGSAAPAAALAFLVFLLTYTPCLATVAEQARQLGGRITALAVASQLAVAWLLAVGVFQAGRLLL